MLDASPSALRAFVLVATYQSFSKAAAALGTRQSTVSSQIARLEEIIGQPLFERSTRRVALASAGERLLPLAEEIVELHMIAAARVEDARLGGTIRLGCTEVIWNAFALTDAVARFARSHPEVSLGVHLAEATEIERMFAANGLDLTLMMNPRDTRSGRVVRRERMRWFGRAPDAAHGLPLPLVETPYESARQAIVRAVQGGESADRVRCTLALRGASLATAIEAISAGIGVGALPAAVGEAHELKLYQGDLPALPSIDVYLLSADKPSAAAVALRTQLLQRLGRSGRTPEPDPQAARQPSVAAKRAR
ncbi:MAG: LysR family transcriptional regulator [Burkholderiaceae bacterium]